MAKYDTKAHEKIVIEAKKRFEQCVEWESDFRGNYKSDIRFANGDPYNNWQWDATVLANNVRVKSPSLTVNKVRQHNLQIINDAKQNKPGVSVRPVGDNASYEAAMIYEDIVRHIEYISNAEQAYDTATTFQVQAGIGYWRVCTDYVGENSFDQEIFIRRIKDPLSVYIDPDINQIDGSDAKFAFIFTDYTKDEFEAVYPDCEDYGQDFMGQDENWVKKDHVRVAEYYRRVDVVDTLIAYTDPQDGEKRFMRKSMMPKELIAAFKAAGEEDEYQERQIITEKIEWYKIAGNKIIEHTTWAGKYIPIVRIIGEETVVDGRMDRKGHTRAMIDAQRMYNYWTSAATEQVALQTKIPFVAAVQAITGYEQYWKTANTENYSVLPYNAVDNAGNPIPMPQRATPPQMADAYIKGMQITQTEMMMASGQYQAQMGQNENAKSGVAINARQRQGDRATYHYIDGLGIGIRFTGKILIDLIPKIYDTPRVLKIKAQDGTNQEINIEPGMKDQAAKKLAYDRDANAIAYAFNPDVGRYEVVADVGPGYATKRQEAFNAFQQIVTSDNGLMPIVGDLLFKNADFPGADELAERLRRMVPPQATKDGPSPQEQQLMQQLQQMQQVIGGLTKELGDKDRELNIKENSVNVNAYKAETDRVSDLIDAASKLDVDNLKAIIVEVLQSMQATPDLESGDQPQADPSALMGAPGGDLAL